MQELFENIKDKCQKRSGIGRNSLVAFLEIIDEVAEEYNNGWIPIEKNSPDEDLKCFVTIKGTNSNKAYTVILRYIEKDNIWYWENRKPLSKAYEILAWRPLMLPEPYQMKGEQG